MLLDGLGCLAPGKHFSHMECLKGKVGASARRVCLRRPNLQEQPSVIHASRGSSGLQMPTTCKHRVTSLMTNRLAGAGAELAARLSAAMLVSKR